MDNYFENSNTKVTVKKYGSTFDRKIVPDKNLIPITERPNRKADQDQALTESMTKFAENINKVNTRELNELKEQRLTEKVMTEGYATLKDELLKDIMRQVCVESLLVDEDVVLENINIIHDLVDSQVDSIGGFKGLKESTAKTKNPVLMSMIEAIDSTAKVVGDRVLQEATCAKEMSFQLNADEVRDFDYKKKDLGVDEITDFVKDRVYKVVQDEQDASKAKGEIMDEIETKLKDADTDVAVEEAMSEIFDTKGLENLTLFESLMRSGYKNLLETSSSAIFESSSFGDDEEDDDEYSMSEIEIDDDDEEVTVADMEEDVEKDLVETEGFDVDVAKVFNNNAPAIMEALTSDDIDALEEALDKMADDVESVSEACKSRSKCNKVKESVRKVQTSTADVIDEACKAKRKACEEELVVCPTCGNDPCTCDVAEEGCKKTIKEENEVKEKDNKSAEELTEGLKDSVKGATTTVREKITDYFQNKLAKKIAKRDFDVVKSNLKGFVELCQTSAELDCLAKDLNVGIKQLDDAKLRYPESSVKIDEHIHWMQTDYKKRIANRRKEIKAQAVKESFDARLDTICESLNAEIDKHENALNMALESVNVVYDGSEICAPMLRAKDCNLSNIEMAYRTKVVCESLKNLFGQVDTIEETKQLEEMVNLNLQYISEAKNSLEGKANGEYKTRLLSLAEGYLRKITKNTGVLTEGLLLEGTEAETDCSEAIAQVRDVYETINNNELMEGTDNEFMEVVLAEAIVKYTVMESFSTLNLQTYNSEEIHKMAKANIR